MYPPKLWSYSYEVMYAMKVKCMENIHFYKTSKLGLFFMQASIELCRKL